MERPPKKDNEGLLILKKRATGLKCGPVVRSNPFGLIRLFLKGYLRRENLERQKKVSDWLLVVHRVRLSQMGKWADLTRKAVLESAVETFRTAFKRELTESERLFLRAHVEEYVQKIGTERIKQL